MKKSFITCVLVSIFGFVIRDHLSAQSTDKIHLENIEPKLFYELLKHSDSIDAHFMTEGIPTNVPLSLNIKRLNGSTALLKKVRVNDKNQIVEFNSGKLFELSFGKFAKGESMECSLSLESDELVTSLFIVPYPIQVNDEFGHILTLKIVNAAGTLFHLEGSGFEPNEKLIYSRETEKDPSWNRNLIMRRPIFRDSIQATKEGKIDIFINPKILSLPSGKASLEIIGKTSRNLKVKYKWGSAAFKS